MDVWCANNINQAKHCSFRVFNSLWHDKIATKSSRDEIEKREQMLIKCTLWIYSIINYWNEGMTGATETNKIKWQIDYCDYKNAENKYNNFTNY